MDNLFLRHIVFIKAFLACFAVAYSQELPPGQVIDTVFCRKVPSQSYALYLPSNYDTLRSWPVIFIFDPAARGSLPVKRFQPAAEKLGYILAGSNNSRNGSYERSFDAGNAMLADVLGRFVIDTNRVYTSGFSGGSRVAISVAILTGKIAGVIACGAGYPGTVEYQPAKGSALVYNALVGDQDMNYQEHLSVEKDLNKKWIINNRIVFHAGHQWPPANYLTEALYWLELQAYKRGKSVSHTFTVSDAYDLVKERADSTYQAQRLVDALYIYEAVAQNFEGLTEISEVESRIAEIKADKTYRKQKRIEARINAQELEYRFKLGEAFQEMQFTRLKIANDSTLKDMDWWENELDRLKRMAARDDVDKRHMALRLINMVWARCAETSFRYEENEDYEMAIILNKIWLYAEPQNTWGHWNMARLYALANEPALALSHLETLISLRPEFDRQTIKTEPAFKKIIETPEMKALVNE